MAFSSAISQFVREGIKHGVRKDGREWDRIRTIEIETGCFELPDGSARLTLGKQTEVIAAIKIDFTSKSELKSCIDGINSYLHDFDNAEKSVMCTVEL